MSLKANLASALIMAALLLVGTGLARAIDEVIQKGKTTSPKGEITKIEKDGVTVTPKIGTPTKVPANEIISVRFEGEPPKLNLARSDEAGGRLDKALEGYLEVQKEAAGKENLKNELDFLVARTTAKLALSDPAKIDAAIAKLEAYRKANPDSYHYYETMSLLGNVSISKKDYAQAKTAFDELAKAPWNDYKMAAQNASARILLLQGDPAGAIKAFDTVIGLKPSSPLEESRRNEALLGKASCLIEQKSYEPALAVLDEVVAQVSGDDVQVQAEAYVRQGDCLQALGRTKEAVLAYLHIDVLFAKEAPLHAEALYHLSRLWGAVGQPERGTDARAQLEKDYPNSPWTQKLASANTN